MAPIGPFDPRLGELKPPTFSRLLDASMHRENIASLSAQVAPAGLAAPVTARRPVVSLPRTRVDASGRATLGCIFTCGASRFATYQRPLPPWRSGASARVPRPRAWVRHRTHKLFVEKEQLLEHFRQNGAFPGERACGAAPTAAAGVVRRWPVRHGPLLLSCLLPPLVLLVGVAIAGCRPDPRR